ncbi:hypothetical protein [Endozoicomonas ascidiicola]|uniref:hypothetical protein n=1 Tax=Endozoicomonas ascidiicola TaxID=1698521 RepID=UPI000B2A07F6|nr:hypothetical protein [Endozoicomonas ascidiicola]
MIDVIKERFEITIYNPIVTILKSNGTDLSFQPLAAKDSPGKKIDYKKSNQ